MNLNVYFGVIREDMNEVWRATMQPDLPWFFQTIGEDPRFFGQDSRISGVSGTAADADDWMHTYIPRLIAEAPKLPFIEAHIEAQRAARPSDRGGTHLIAMVQSMVRGWTEADEVEFIAPWRQAIERLPPDNEYRAALQAKLPRVRAWIDAHPSGLVDRELTGR